MSELKIQIPAPNIRTIGVTIVGTAPLIFHAWSQKAIQMIEDKQQKKATKGRETRNPVEEYESSFYYTLDREIAIKADHIKSAITGSGRFLDVKMTTLRGSVFVRGDMNGRIPVLIKGERVKLTKIVPREDWTKADAGLFIEEVCGYDKDNKDIQMRKDMVTVGMGTADVRYRGQLTNWSVEFLIEFDADIFSPEQILNLIQRAGFSQGLMEWRPERDGTNGTFEVKMTSENALG